MNFADDDLLKDILSDGSNDSFFDDPIPKPKKKLSKTEEKSSDSTKKNPKPDDWLGSERPNQETTAIKSKDDWLGLDKTSENDSKEGINKSLNLSRKPVKKISFEDDDILGTLGLTTKPTNKAEKPIKDDLLSDIIPSASLSSKEKKGDFLGSILKPSKKEGNIPDILGREFASNSSTAGASASDFPSTSSVKENVQESGRILPREGRRRRVTSGLVDPLGLFTGSETNKDDSAAAGFISETSSRHHTRANSFSSGDIKDIDTLSSNKSVTGDVSRSAPNLLDSQTGLPDWLGGASSKTKSLETDWGTASSIKSKSEVTLSDKSENNTVKTNETMNRQIQSSETSENPTDRQHLLNSFLTQQKMTQSQIDYQNTSLSLQQQESQILMALQMKKYEDNLTDIQRHQHEILLKQEQQFNALLERQFAKQNAMENNMRLQQERINNHIQLLISQPRIDTPIQKVEEEMERAKKLADEEHTKIYEETIANLKQRQRDELFILEEYYKKQITVLEETTQNTENRLKAELQSVLSKSEESSQALREEYQREISDYQRKIEEIKEEHAKDMKMIRDNNARVIEEIKYEQNVLIENIKESKKAESSVMGNSEEFRSKLDGNIELLHKNSQILQLVSGKMENDFGVLHTAKEESLKAKEKEIEMMRVTLETCREKAEVERSQLLGLVRTLETKIAEQSQEAREERWALQQAVATFAARATAFDRETEFTKASLEREREQLKTLRENLFAEQERTMLQLTEEKLAISAEKSRLEISNKLGVQFDSQKVKAELEAALNVAKNATEMTDKERENLQRQIIEVETKKRYLQDQERKLASREMELTRLYKMADQKSLDGEKALEEARIIEARCNDRTKQLQQRLSQLSAREKKITEDKIALSKERIALNTQMKKAMCSLCANEEPQNDVKRISGSWNDDVDVVGGGELPHFPRFEVSDAEIFRLQFEDKEERRAQF